MENITIQSGPVTVTAYYNTATGQIGLTLAFPNGAGVPGTADNIEGRLQQILSTGEWAGQPFSAADLDVVRSVLADLPNILSKVSTLSQEPPATEVTPTPPTPSNDQVQNPEPTPTQPYNENDGTGANDPGIPLGNPPDVPAAQGSSRDDSGLLLPGWFYEPESGTDIYIGGDYIDPSTRASAEETRNGMTGAKADTQATATTQDASSFQKAKDWRVRLSLAPGSTYLYNVKPAESAGILKPLAATNGVIFPYTPSVSVSYNASYEGSDLIHSNYKIYNYKNSTVDNVTITGEFTAQDTNEANYLLAVIHFFRSVTKMFYGRDNNPRNGVPPPLCYLSGLGAFQFDNHPLVITNFTYTLPTEVDYIRAGSQTNSPGNPTGQQTPPVNTDSSSLARMVSSGLRPKQPNFQRQASTINSNATYVPTRMQIAISCLPIVTRNDISNSFSLKDYATGALLQGSNRNGGGIW